MVFSPDKLNTKDQSQGRGIVPMFPDSKTFHTENNTLLLNINKNSIDLSVIREIAKQKGFDEKKEFHITVLGFKNGAKIKKLFKELSVEDSQKKLTEIQLLIDGTDWSFIPEKSVYHILKEYKSTDPQDKSKELSETRESYIQKVDMPVMQAFYEKLNNITGLNLETPPPHFTLYTNGTDKEKAKMGIGINSEAELEQLNPERIIE